MQSAAVGMDHMRELRTEPGVNRRNGDGCRQAELSNSSGVDRSSHSSRPTASTMVPTGPIVHTSAAPFRAPPGLGHNSQPHHSRRTSRPRSSPAVLTRPPTFDRRTIRRGQDGGDFVGQNAGSWQTYARPRSLTPTGHPFHRSVSSATRPSHHSMNWCWAEREAIRSGRNHQAGDARDSHYSGTVSTHVNGFWMQDPKTIQ